jgi:hypothetical protein
MNLEPRVSCASHNSLPRAKDGKRQKWLELDVQAIFSQSLRVQQVAPTVSPVGSVGASALCAEVSTGDPHPLQGRQNVYLFYSVRFSHFTDSLNAPCKCKVRFFSENIIIQNFSLKD